MTSKKLILPRYTLGVDIETKDTKASAYILSIAAVLFDNYTLSIVACFRTEFDPDDPEQSERTVSERTIDWWETRNDNIFKFPSQQAYDLTWSGTASFRAGMESFHKFMKQNPRDGVTVCTMRGPDFDYVILNHALTSLGIYGTFKPSLLDSHRTVERFIDAMGIPGITDEEYKLNAWKGPIMPHVAQYDAAIEGYQTARAYYVAHHIKEHGYDKTIDMLSQWQAQVPMKKITPLYTEQTDAKR